MTCKHVQPSQGNPKGRLSLLVRDDFIVLGSSRWPSFPVPKELRVSPVTAQSCVPTIL